MTVFILRRLAITIPTVIAILVMTFVLIRLAPGDPAQAYVESGGGAQALEQARERLGLNAPVHVQFVRYMSLVVRGDLGRSLINQRSVMGLLLDRYPYTLQLAAAALVIALLVAIPAGVFSALNQNTALDRTITVAAVVAYSMPRFWLAMLLVLLFSVTLMWFPVIGAGQEGNLASVIRHLTLPAIAMGLSEAAFLTRMTRSAVIEELRKDYVRTAHSKGQTASKVVLKHVLRNAAIPVVTVVGFSLANMLSGSIVIEAVFVRPGVGQLLLEGINQRDYTVVQGGIISFSLGIILLNLLVDISYGALDPRIRYE